MDGGGQTEQGTGALAMGHQHGHRRGDGGKGLVRGPVQGGKAARFHGAVQQGQGSLFRFCLRGWRIAFLAHMGRLGRGGVVGFLLSLDSPFLVFHFRGQGGGGCQQQRGAQGAQITDRCWHNHS